MGNAKIPACFIFYLGPYACHHSTVPCVASTQRGRERVSRMLCLDDAALCGPYVCYVRQHQVIVVCVWQGCVLAVFPHYVETSALFYCISTTEGIP